MDMSYCRLCAEMKLNVELIAIFNESSNLHHIIVQCFQILVNSNDNLPKMVCSNCCKQTLSFYEFYQRLQRAQQILQNLFNKGGNHENQNDIKTANSCKNENGSRLQTDGSANDNYLLFNIKNEYPFSSEISSSDHATNNALHTTQYNNFSSTELSNIKKVSNDLSDESISDNKSLLENGNDELKEEEVDDKDTKISEKIQKGKKITVFKDHLGEEWKDYIWRCNICADEFKKKKKLEKHFTDEHGKTVEYECEDCSDNYISFDEFKNHVSLHRELVEYRCKSCDEWFLSSLRYKRHMYNTHGESETLTSICSICGKSYKTLKSLKDHIRIIHEGVSEEYECDICHKKYDRKTSLYIHKRKHEDYDYSGDEKPVKKRRSRRSDRESDADEYFECNLCHKSFAKSSTLNRHKKKHQSKSNTKSEWQLKWEEYRKRSVEEWKDYVWSCIICNEDMKTKAELEKHFKETHGKPVQFLCIECQKTFPKFVNFKKHVRRHRFFAEFRCKLCNKWFASDSHLKRHTLTVHEIKTLNYVCPTCGKRFKTSMSLNYHKRYIHESTRDYECDICHKKYTSPVGLNNHKHSHKVGKAYQCELCGLNVSSKGNLDVHMLYKHTDNKDNPGEGERCTVCSKIFKTRIHLYRHNRRVHNAVRYECKICGKSCSDKTSFNLHLTIHTGELPHECNYCQKKFRLKKSLKIHIRQHTGEKPHHCDKCSHSFTDYANYLKHMKRKHGYLTRHDLDVTKQQHQPDQQQQHQQLPQQQLQQQQLQQR